MADASANQPAAGPVDEELARLSFEQALERLETIVAEMEDSDLSLEDCMKHFAIGSQLANLCTDKLQQAERQIEILLADASGGSWAPFDGPADG